MIVKNLLREGKVVWLRATVDNEHLVNAKWLAQCCRTAHRAGVPWSMRVSATQPWSVPALMSLKKMIYVSLKKVESQAEGAYYVLVSDAVNLEHLDLREFKEQLRKRFMSSDAQSLATATVGREWPIEGAETCQTQWQKRAHEDELALGGLRNPHKSIKQLKGAPTMGKKLRQLIDEYIESHRGELTAALVTLGKEEMPQALADAARALMTSAGRLYEVPLAADGELQGELLQKLVEELGDPETEVARWILEEKAPLGIERPIRPCGVFPIIEPKLANDEVDHWATSWNYATFSEHREGAERLLRKEQEAGWLEWFPNDAAAEEKHGKVPYSRIGVIEKWKDQKQKLRLIQDLRRSGVNQQVTMHERIILRRISDYIADV